MKRNFTLPACLILLGVALSGSPAFSQLNNSGFHARFGVDADTKTDYIKYGDVNGEVESDDWFSTSGHSHGVIDTTNASVYRSNLMAGANISFVKRMSVPLYYKTNNTMWIDAVYSRDYVKGSVSTDNTAFVSAAGNMDDPATWKGGASNVATKTDMVDVFAHMRRNGTNIKDSLWLFTAVSTIGTTGSRYFDIELYKNRMSFNPMTGNFSSGGPDEGHTQWKFDAAGRVTQTGDIIIGVTYSPGSAPVIEIRLWVAKTAFSSVTPAHFDFGSNFDAFSNKSVYGYGDIVSKSGATAFGSGVGNYSTSNDTTYSTPWGSTGTAWSSNYESLQLVEMGINLSRIGIDPALYSTLGTAACGTFFKSIFFKSRSSGSFAANLNDFVGPLDFLNVPTLDYAVQPDTLSCRKSVALLPVSAKTTAAAYTWKALNGGRLVAANTDSSGILVDKAGVYVVNGAVATGCPVTRRDTLVVQEDMTKPVASADIGSNSYGQVQLYGGDTAASNKPTPFGHSKGLSWHWTGPNGFTSDIQNPIISNNWGTYNLTVTEKRNGCVSNATVYAMVSILPANKLQVSASRSSSFVIIKWVNADDKVVSYTIEKKDQDRYTSIGETKAVNAEKMFSFVDRNVSNAGEHYRIKAVSQDGSLYYSNVIHVKAAVNPVENIFLTGNYPGSKLNVVMNAPAPANATVLIISVTGTVIAEQHFSVKEGFSSTEIPFRNAGARQLAIVSVYFGNRPVYTGKILL
jgi:hypothetical protein